MAQSHVVHLLFAFSWGWMIIGPVTGMMMSLWAFGGPLKPPRGHEDYASPERRLLRIGHINAFVFPFIGILYGLTLNQTALSLELKQIGASLTAFSTVGMTIIPIASIRWKRIRLINPIAVLALIGALGIIFFGFINQLSV